MIPSIIHSSSSSRHLLPILPHPPHPPVPFTLVIRCYTFSLNVLHIKHIVLSSMCISCLREVFNIYRPRPSNKIGSQNLFCPLLGQKLTLNKSTYSVQDPWSTVQLHPPPPLRDVYANKGCHCFQLLEWRRKWWKCQSEDPQFHLWGLWVKKYWTLHKLSNLG